VSSGNFINVAEAFTPFDGSEVGRLERYAKRTRELFETTFIQQGNTSWTLKFERGGPLLSSMGGSDERELKEALMVFRPLYLEREEAGFGRIQAMVKRHAHDRGTEDGRRTIAIVKTYSEALKDIRRADDLMQLREERVDTEGAVVSTETVTPARVFDDFLYGHYFHEDEQRRARIGDDLPSEAQRFIFMSTVKRIARVYTGFAGTANAILREPALRA